MKFHYKLPIWVLAFLIALCVAETTTLVYFFLKIFGVAGFMSNSLPVEITMSIICVLGLIFSLFLLTLHYKVSNSHFELKFGFWDLLKKKVFLSKICNVVYKKSGNLLLISYMAEALDPVIMIVAIDTNKADKFANALKSVNPKIVYTTE